MERGVSTACQTRVRSLRPATEAERRDASRARACAAKDVSNLRAPRWSPATSGEHLRCGGGCGPGVVAVELRAWPHRRPWSSTPVGAICACLAPIASSSRRPSAQARSPSSTSSSTTSPWAMASCARSSGGRRRSSGGPRACIRASSSRRVRRAAATPSFRSAFQRELRITCRPRGSSSRRVDTRMRSVPRRWLSSAGRPRWARSRFIRGRFAATTSTIRTSCASTWIRSRAGISPTPCASRLRHACSWTSLAIQVSRRPREAEVSTSMSGSRAAGRSRTFATPRSPSGVSSSAVYRPGHDQLVEGGARRAHLHRLQPERPRSHDRLRLQRPTEGGRAGLRTGHVGRARRGRAWGLHGRDHARALCRGRRSPRDDRRSRPLAAAAAGHVRERCRRGTGGHALPTRLSEDAGRAQARSALARS